MKSFVPNPNPDLDEVREAFAAAELADGFYYATSNMVCANTNTRMHPVVVRSVRGLLAGPELHAIALALNYVRQRLREDEINPK